MYLAHKRHHRHSREHPSRKLVLVAPRPKAGRVSVESGRARTRGDIPVGERPRLLLDGLEAAAVQGVLDRFDAACIFPVEEAVPCPFEGTGDRVDWNVVDGLRHDERVDYDQEYRDLGWVGGSVFCSCSSLVSTQHSQSPSEDSRLENPSAGPAAVWSGTSARRSWPLAGMWQPREARA